MSEPKTKASSLWVKAHGGDEEVFPAGAKWSLSEMQAKVGGFIERVSTTHLAKGQIMFVNEEGLVKGLSRNRRASIVAGRDIVGDVLIVPEEQVA